MTGRVGSDNEGVLEKELTPLLATGAKTDIYALFL
jgi:hypothetical protein